MTMDHGGKQRNGSRNMKNANVVPKDVQKNRTLHKILKKYNDQWGVLQKKVFLNFFKKTAV